ncbi:U6 snRNA phosphodiesterase Usb1 [Cladochytrium replicatum]|nr:U6 snRNA phosphodiesterase Usb1 [Cladochytrium replicatum]
MNAVRLVDYSDSEDEEEAQSTSSGRDDRHPSGRVRTVPHIEGNWATTVVVSISPSDDLLDLIALILQDFNAAAKQSTPIRPILDSENTLGLHVSLSRTVYIKGHQIDPLVANLSERIRTHRKFELGFNAVSVYVNDEGTRSFVSMDAGLGTHNLKSCLVDVDEVMAKFSLPTFYDPPKFHASIGWAPGESIHESIVTRSEFEGYSRALGWLKPFPVPSVRVQVGNRIFEVRLS